MAYGSGLYRMMLNPFAQAKSSMFFIFFKIFCFYYLETAMTVDINHYVNSKLKDIPQIAYDLQFIPDEVIQNRGRLATNFRYALTVSNFIRGFFLTCSFRKTETQNFHFP